MNAHDVPPRVFLIGPMGAGKTAVGKRLARLLGYVFHDSDDEVETRTGVDIGFIFEKEGEAGFRRRERDAIGDLSQLDRIVLATGGGAVVDDENRRWLTTRGFVVYLEASVTQQLERTRRTRTRPLLDDPDPEKKLADLLAGRDPLYREIADLCVTTDGRRVDAVAKEVYQLLQTTGS